MRVRPGVLALAVGLWGLAVLLLGRHGGRSACPLGACPACGLCFRPPPRAEAAARERVG